MLKQKLGPSQTVSFTNGKHRLLTKFNIYVRIPWCVSLQLVKVILQMPHIPFVGISLQDWGNNWWELQYQENEQVTKKHLPPNRGHGHLQSRTGPMNYLLRVPNEAEQQSASHVDRCKKAARGASLWKAATAAKGWEPRGSRSHLELHTLPGGHAIAHNHGEAVIISGNSLLHCCPW